ncbi:MAG TPA: tetratricopeptide repeat protein [Bryobacteraceae bacterium]|nr:tetratricopeptide repeat protein [Bryobacteraceae bacterium]
MKRLLFLSIVLTPILFGQKREDILSIQRDVANLQDLVRQLQKSQDEKMAALQAMLQQTVDASVKLTGGLTNLQRDVDKKLSDQQGALVAPVAATNVKIDQMSDDFRSVAINVAELVKKMDALDRKLTDVKSAISTIQNPVPLPAPVPGQIAVPSGPSAETLWENARRDQSSGKLELAMDEYQSYVKNFDKTENAPAAQYQVGYLYFQAGQYEDAVKAFDMVLEHWGENPKTQEALYYKAVSLQKAKSLTDAGRAYKEYLAKYPHGEHVQNAHQNLRALGMESSPRSTSKKRP